MNIGQEGWFDEEFRLALQDLDPKASVGFGPLSRLGATIGTALDYDPIRAEFNPSRVALLKDWTRIRMQEPEAPDPILVFVKPEPHSTQKLEEGRYRLISAVGMVDTMVDRVMFGWLQRAVMSNVGRTPVMVGWSPYKGGYRHISLRFAGRRALCIDRKSWDWTVPGWLLKIARHVIAELAVGAPQFWLDWLEKRWIALFRDAVFGFRSGERIQQPGWGVMKSGCYLTILLNSICQVILHFLACSRLGIDPQWELYFCMGDDSVQAVMGMLNEYLDELRGMGSIIKEWTASEDIEFCGHKLGITSVRPVYLHKHMFKIITADRDLLPLLLSAYQCAYAHDQELWIWLTRELTKVAPALVRKRAACLSLLHEG